MPVLASITLSDVGRGRTTLPTQRERESEREDSYALLDSWKRLAVESLGIKLILFATSQGV